MTDDPMHLPQEPRQLASAARCGAKTRSGKPCRSAAVAGRRRCRMHGGAKGSGGPKGARNGNYRHGRYTAEMIASRRWLREMTREVRALASSLRGGGEP
jgi:glucans biosynthesis protein